MSAPSRFLVVVSEKGVSATRDEQVAIVRRLLDIEPLTTAERAFQIGMMGFAVQTAARALSEKYRRKVSFEESEDLLVDLVQALMSSAPQTMLPTGTRVFREGEGIPATFKASDGSFKQLIVYAAHPADEEFFIPVAQYHPYLLQDKRAEFVRLAAALGAREIRLCDTDNQASRAGWNVGGAGPVKGVPVDFAAKGAAHSESSSSFNLSAVFSRPEKPPALPGFLRWYQQEPLWKAMAETRLEYRTESFKVQFTYDHDFGVSADLALKIASLGFSAGGSFSSVSKVSQEYEVIFYPPNT